MPQAIQPGSYAAMYSQQLMQTILTQATQMLAGGGAAGGLGGLGGLTGQPSVTNPNLLPAIDSALSNTVAIVDSQLASVGIGVSSGVSQAPTAPTLAGKPVASPLQAGSPLSLTSLGNLSALA